ncbi:SH3 domain-containing protein [Microvirga splendida]|uniref:SH3 domain-containing protein n=1 Tax=Microvirga splendida TaxID=2795727 RepID=A0ABS0Y0C8_9HYPH|nr:SH3 domain-containing protein [Microvirga splendida]MBJ6125388.1 SH3 domain-containing protein [Microvirga splendida]
MGRRAGRRCAPSSFSDISPAKDARHIRHGDRLVSNTSINIRKGPGDFSSIVDVLPKGSAVLIEDIKLLQTRKRPQFWLKISIDRNPIIPPGAGAANAPTPTDELATLSAKAQAIVSCYVKLSEGQRTPTIREVNDCSGYWVTPRALLRCSIGAACPALPNPIDGLATFETYLASANLTKDSPLKLNAKDIPRRPYAARMNSCRQGRTEAEFIECSATEVVENYSKVVDCARKLTVGEQLACHVGNIPDANLVKLTACLGGGKPSPDKIVQCITTPEIEEQVTNLRNCVVKAGNLNASRDCVLVNLPTQQREMARCMSGANASRSPIECLAQYSPEMARAGRVAECLGKSGVERTRCLESVPGMPPAVQTASCLLGPEEARLSCLMGNTPEARTIQAVSKCLANGRSTHEMLANCTGDLVPDAKTRETMSCVIKGGGEKSQIARCAIIAGMPPETMRLVACTSSGSPISFFGCAVGPAMNEEWRIALECAETSGGESVSFIGCTGGRLTLMELTKCFTGGDCFGPNNTIVVAVRNAYNDLLHGPGANNDLKAFVDNLAQITGGPNSVVNDPGQIFGGPNSVFNNPRQLFGGDGSVFNDPGQVFDPRRWRW